MSITFLEIYNESLYDLLEISTQPHEINIYENSKGMVAVNGVKSFKVRTEAEALALLFEVRWHARGGGREGGREGMQGVL